VDGFTTNPSLIRNAGPASYEQLIKDFLSVVGHLRPVSFEVVADDWPEMERQAVWLSGFGPNVYVKIPIVTTQGASNAQIIHRLSTMGLKLNITAILTAKQVQTAVEHLRPSIPSIISIFAGRIADTGRDPVPTMQTAVQLAKRSGSHVLWASAREVLNVYQAQDCGCDIITLAPALLDKLTLQEKDLDDYSRETVQMFYNDAQAAGLTIPAETLQ
jgi:transaldolase